ncbi:MAG: hypothetical protein F4X56_03965 [Gammaproteobacteria bacterium]|nr:hypothetical protein [Gammaproteobacteria bacterium]MYC25058.1 hypothetical protein [Gammaproteobacteria bacterium]
MRNTFLKANPKLLLPLITVVVVAISFALGYLFASQRKFESSNVATKEVPISTQRATTSSPTEENLLSLSEALDPSQFESRFARISRFLEILAEANVQVIATYWEQGKVIDAPKFREEVQQKIVRRWAVLDPPEALNAVLKHSPEEHRLNLIKLVFLEWSLASLDEARVRALSLDQASKEAAVSGMVLAREDLSVSERRQIARELDCEWIAIEVLNSATTQPVIANPAVEFKNFVESNFANFQKFNSSQSLLFGYLVHAWVVQDGVDVIEIMSEALPSDFSLLATAEFVSSQLLLAQPQLAMEFLVELVNRDSDERFRELAVKLVGEWAEWDVDAALDSTFTVEARAFRRELQRRVLEEFAQSDPPGMLGQIHNLPENLQSLAHEIALIEIAVSSPEKVADSLGDLREREQRDRVAAVVVANWAVKNVNDVLHWISTDPKVAHYRSELIEVALRELARTNPQKAFDTAVTLPLNTEGQGWEGRVIFDLMARDIDSAVSMLPKVRAGPTRREAYDWVIFDCISWENDSARAIELLIEMCEVEPMGTRYSTLSLASRAPRQVFEALDKISSAYAKAELANWLIRYSDDHGMFSDEELEILERIKRAKPRTVSPRFIKAAESVRQLRQEEPVD